MVFYHGGARYAQFPGYHVLVAVYNWDDKIRVLCDDLEGGDQEALDAGDELKRLKKEESIWLTNNDNPIIAMTDLINEIRKYYFEELGSGDIWPAPSETP